ncbi:MAG: glycerate kinase type-2 family protein [Thermaceae bacterium]
MKRVLEEVFSKALKAVHPHRLTQAALPPDPPDLILAVGKGALGMLRAALEAYPGRPCHLTLPKGQEAEGLRAVFAGHPLPDRESLRAAKEVLRLLKSLPEKAHVLALISGGGSALWEAPWGLSLREVQALNRALLLAGASIQEINTVRKHLSRVKGGRLLQATRARVSALILSDVPGDDPSFVASGPFHPDPTTYAEALSILDRYGLKAPRVRTLLEKGLRGELPETLKPKDPETERLSWRVVGRNLDLLLAAKRLLEARGLPAHILSDRLGGEAQALGRFHGEVVETIRQAHHPFPPPVVLLSGGEAQVRVKGKGQGGRNLEFLLSLYAHLQAPLYALAADSDGLDGPSGAAGGLLTPEVWRLGLDARPYLARNDSLSFFQKAGTLLRTGPTGNNLNDFRMILVE